MKNLNVRRKAIASTVLASAFAFGLALPAQAANVDQNRLNNADAEPQNWLLPFQNYQGHMFSRLNQVNRTNVANLKVAFTVPIGSAMIGNPNLNLENAALVDDGMMFISDGWGAIYKIDMNSGDKGKILWKADGAVSKDERNRDRGMALWGNAVYANETDGRVLAVNRDTGEFLWDKQVGRVAWQGKTDTNNKKEGFDAAPLGVEDKILVGQSAGDDLTRGWLEALDAKTGNPVWRTYMVPAPGEPGSETWKDKNQAWKVGGAALWTTGTYDPDTKVTLWGTGNAQPMFDAEYRPGDNLFAGSVVAMNVADGKIKWYFQYTPNEGWDYDENGVHQIITLPINGVNRKILGHWGRNGFFYRLDGNNGQFLDATQYVDQVTWTKGIDPKTGKPVEYDPNLDVQKYIPEARPARGRGQVTACPTATGGVRWQPVAYNPNTYMSYSAGRDGCFGKEVIASVPATTNDGMIDAKAGGGIRGAGPTKNILTYGLISAVNVQTNKLVAKHREPYDNVSGATATAGGLVFTGDQDGKVVAYDDQTLQELWHFNTGISIKAPVTVFAIGGKEYIGVMAGGAGGASLAGTFPDLAQMSTGAVYYVFSL